MKRCSNCVLPESFPGISFDEHNVCNFCNSYKGEQHLANSKKRYILKFENLIKQHKRNNSYDCLMAYSGGKDSSYTLFILKKFYRLNTLALTFDNGFLSPIAFKNIRNIVENLGVDHMIIKPRFDILKKIFIESSKRDLFSKKTLERASTICTSCMGLVKFISLKIALEKNIPFVVYGWSPGQAPITASIFKNNPTMLKYMQRAIHAPLHSIVGDEINNYFLKSSDFSNGKGFPYNISPLAFWDYDEEKIYNTIKQLGWEKPDDTDSNSTNCLLNAYGNVIHKNKFKFHPYAAEMAKLVREGYLKRNEALSKLESKENPTILKYVQNKLNG